MHSDGRAYNTGGLCRYQYCNHLGSACVELDHHAMLISYQEYHPLEPAPPGNGKWNRGSRVIEWVCG